MRKFREVMGTPSPPKRFDVQMTGPDVLHGPFLNKGDAFTIQERAAFGLTGLLPEAVTTLNEQTKRAYLQYQQQPDDPRKNDLLVATGTEPEGNGLTLPDLLRAPSERVRIVLFILLLTLNAGWTDMLCYLSLGHVFSSFLTGNFLFIGLGLAQGNSGLLIRALVAVLVSFVGVTLGSFCLQRAPQRQTEPTSWHNTFVRILLMEWLLLLVFAILWHVTSNLSQQAGVQILLLGLAALGMGIQGALIQAFNFPGVVANALTGTVLALGQRLAQGLGHPGPESQEWRWGTLFRLILCFVYVGSALVVALTLASMLTPVVPMIIVTIAIFALFFPSRRATRSLPTSSS